MPTANSTVLPDRPVGVLGLGLLGLALLGRLQAQGIAFVAYDPDAGARQQLEGSAAAHLAPALFDFGDAADVVVSTLTDAHALKAAILGDADRPGFAASLRTGSIIVHFGAGPHDVVLKLTGVLGSRGIGLVDVFTCNGIAAAIEGRMELLVGGHADIIDRVRPVLSVLGSVERIGQTGAAVGLAALRGYVRAARLIALSEALLIGSQAGISREVMARVFDGTIATGPQGLRLAGMATSKLTPAPLLVDTYRAVADAVEFGERIGLSGDGISFARDLLADALETTGEAADETALLCHFSEVAADADAG